MRNHSGNPFLSAKLAPFLAATDTQARRTGRFKVPAVRGGAYELVINGVHLIGEWRRLGSAIGVLSEIAVAADEISQLDRWRCDNLEP